MSGIHGLIDHATWANRTWMAFIHDHGWQRRPAQLLSHVVLAEAVWMQRICNGPVDSEVFRILPHFEMQERIERHNAMMHLLCTEQSQKSIAYRRFNGDAHESLVADILMHVVTHGFHHRGQISTHFAQEGLRSPPTDFLTFSATRERPSRSPS